MQGTSNSLSKKRGKKKSKKKVQEVLAAQPQMFAVPECRARIPKKFYKQLSPQNHLAKFPHFETLNLLGQGRICSTITERKLAPVRANSSWLKCLEILEKHGMVDGVHYLDVADALSLRPDSVRSACLKAEQIIFDIYGLHVGFFSGDGIFKLAIDAEVAVKHRLLMKEIKAKALRLLMYQGAAEEFAQPEELLQIQLFGPLELPRGETKPKHHPN